MHKRTRSQRFALLQQTIYATGLAVRDPIRITRMALLDLEHQELTDLVKGVVQPEEYYDMELPLFDSPSQHSTPCTPMPFIPPASPLMRSSGVTPFASPETYPQYMQYPSPLPPVVQSATTQLQPLQPPLATMCATQG